ncbi:MAG: hypothetical protein HY787_11660 [Deltaproteobacteria bacterium]|nr:hypothetical protein [Deltaproteobacteria bacterium]
MHMIALCLIRLAMLEAGSLANVTVAQLSFSRALTETRLFLKTLLATAEILLWSSLYAAFVLCCSRHRVQCKPDRHFSRDRQLYRKKSRGIVEPRRKGRKRKSVLRSVPESETVKSETIKDSKDRVFLLS